MAKRRSPEIPESILLLQQQLDQWRAAQKGGQNCQNRSGSLPSTWPSGLEFSERPNRCGSSVRAILLPDGVQPDQLAAKDIGKILQSSANDDYRFGNISS